MAANTTPVYPLTPVNSWATVVTTANTAKDGTGTQLTIITGTENGTRVDELRFIAIGTNVATVARITLNNGSTNATASNNSPYLEVALPATTTSETTLITPGGVIVVPLRNCVLKSGYKLNIAIGTTVASGWCVTAMGGDI